MHDIVNGLIHLCSGIPKFSKPFLARGSPKGASHFFAHSSERVRSRPLALRQRGERDRERGAPGRASSPRPSPPQVCGGEGVERSRPKSEMRPSPNVRIAPRCGGKETNRDVSGETPNTAVETTALPTDRISEHSRLFESIRGSTRKPLISMIVSESSGKSLPKTCRPANRPFVIRCSPHLQIRAMAGCLGSIGTS
jgi:hypothetical protein